ncbi:Similar to S.cerevisiae protein ACB1 (Acyl-CoA-binding protein) [Malassezia sympodialis ATCC 42132]|uniref:Similar to S.cerevisiae protein ACB1 (Acyl-CoA-binding protein) n=1 Tax=Malassezia sympodialis (strain ATCC 42132) TaxID=1230383 RepID=A0A1M8A9K2_MALS4|nr:Similar to S.cerevisiae protein ACB1 (Acyl-CoA-binding protein) [Malassezia sympodialis ATCC 42132]
MSDTQFQKAVEIIRNLPKNSPAKVTQAQQLRIYGLYKQATEGDVSTSRPGMLDFTGRAKWDAWNSEKGKSSEQAKKDYVDLFIEIFTPLKDDAEFNKYLEEVKNA